MQSGASPGGPRLSSAKKRRLAALEQSLATGEPPKKLRADAQQQSQQSGHQREAAGGSRGGTPAPDRRRASAPGPGRPSPLATAPSASEQSQSQLQQQRDPLYHRLEALGLTSGGPLAAALGLAAAEAAADGRVVSALLEDLMATNPRAFDSRAAIGLKLQDRTLMLENPAAAKPAGRRKARRFASRLVSHGEQRRLGLYQLSGAGLTFEGLQPLHRRWQQYMSGLLQGTQPAAAAAPGRAGQQGGGSMPTAPSATCLEDRLLAANLHGCLMRVAEAREQRYQGAEGIVVRDTQQTLQLVTRDNRLLTIPKAACTWEYDADTRRTVTLLGPGLVGRRGGGSGGRQQAAPGQRRR